MKRFTLILLLSLPCFAEEPAPLFDSKVTFETGYIKGLDTVGIMLDGWTADIAQNPNDCGLSKFGARRDCTEMPVHTTHFVPVKRLDADRVRGAHLLSFRNFPNYRLVVYMHSDQKTAELLILDRNGDVEMTRAMNIKIYR